MHADDAGGHPARSQFARLAQGRGGRAARRRLGETPPSWQLRTAFDAAKTARQADFDTAQAFLVRQDISELSAKIEAVGASQHQAQADFATTCIETFQKRYEENVLEGNQLLEQYEKLAVEAGVRAATK